MDPEMVRRIDTVLDAVKDAESGYSAQAKKLLVFTNPLSGTHGCCTLIALSLLEDVLGRLLKELGKEFPDLTVCLADPASD
jgi:hypothetical protein